LPLPPEAAAIDAPGGRRRAAFARLREKVRALEERVRSLEARLDRP